MSALRLYGSAFAPIVLTAALALAPAMLLMSGSVAFGLAATADAPAASHTETVQGKRQDALATGDSAKHREAAREALEGGAASFYDLRGVLRAALVAGLASLLLLIGLSLAQAALVPVVASAGAIGPAEAWNTAGRHFAAVLRTCAVGACIVAVGAVLFVIPGVLAALAFSFAVPAAVVEGLAGAKALERSHRLVRGQWGRVAGWWLLVAVIVVAGGLIGALLPPGIWRVLAAAAFRTLLLPLPLVGLVLAYVEARPTRAPAPRPDATTESRL